MRSIEFVPDAFYEYQRWIETDRRIELKIGDLIRDILRNPFFNFYFKIIPCEYGYYITELSIIRRFVMGNQL